MNQNLLLLFGVIAAVYFVFVMVRSKKSIKEIRKVMEGKAKIVDVRSPAEFAGGSYPGAVNIPVDQISARISEFGDKNGAVIVFCASGMRSARAKAMLDGAGFTNVTNAGTLSNMMSA
ncbi:MAG TPA: rhodanese-like domain-containing protein [Leptospiraceae bacterium]|nr:rhodanese-like domain-containing protein [Leptospiraceae bacterium]